jgi:hypothetical protein
LTDAVACFASLNDRKIERSMDKSVAVCEINPAAEWDQTVTLSMGLTRVGRSEEVSCGIRGRGGSIAGFVVLQPETLICGIVPNVIVMEGEEFHKEAAILEA